MIIEKVAASVFTSWTDGDVDEVACLTPYRRVFLQYMYVKGRFRDAEILLHARKHCDVTSRLEFKLSPWKQDRFLVLGFFHGERGKFSETSSGNSTRTPCENPKTQNQV